MTILFYLKRDPYGWLSNFSPHSIEMKGRVWPTVEHYYQAQKFAGTEHEEQVRQAPFPLEAKSLAHDGGRPVRPDWDAVKDGIMEAAVLRKFETHPDLRALLLATGDEELVEDAPDDYYWGRGADGTGTNTLGKILMKVRSLLRDRAGGPSMSEMLDRIIQELLDLHVGGVPFFDHLDATWRSPRGWPVVEHLLARAAVQPHPSNPAPFEKTFPGANAVSTGRFGMFLNNAFGVDLLLATGGLRTTAPMDDLWYVRQKLERGQGRDFILLDDSFYSGQTRNLIRQELERQGGRLVHTYVVYDGNRERDPHVSALYRYYDQFAPSQGQANLNVRVGGKQPS